MSAPDAHTDPLLGQTVDEKFTLNHLIATGGMGRVYHARDKSIGRDVAVKILDVKNNSSKDFTARFIREAQTLSSLQHANTVRTFGHGQWNSTSYLVMELVKGRSLKAILDEGKIPTQLALSIAVQICSALQEAHQKGIIHRDLKPENVLIIEEDNHFVKLIDFGLVKNLNDNDEMLQMTQAGQILGSVMYISPEQIENTDVDQRADVYTMGALLYEMLMGQTLFQHSGLHKILLCHLNEKPRPFSKTNPDLKLPPCIEWTVRTCLKKKQSDRFNDAKELRKALESCLLSLNNTRHRNIRLKLEDGKTKLPPSLRSASPMTAEDATSSPITRIIMAIIGLTAVAIGLWQLAN